MPPAPRSTPRRCARPSAPDRSDRPAVWRTRDRQARGLDLARRRRARPRRARHETRRSRRNPRPSGDPVALAARSVQVFRLEVTAIAPPDLRLFVVCSSGTYVRAIARDLGRALGSAAHLARLRRLAVGALEARDALTPEELRARGREATALLQPANDDLLTLDPRFLEASAATIVGAGESA